MSINLTYDGTDAKTVDFIKAKKPAIIAALLLKVHALMIALQAHIVGDKLSGQVLNHRTGKLIGSIRLSPTTPVANGDEIVAGIAGGGGVAAYGKIHEYGGTFNVKQRLVTQVFGNKLKSPIFTKPYTMKFPERSYMRSSFSDMRQTIIDQMQKALQQAVESK